MPRALVGYVSSFFLQGTKLLLTQGDKKETFCILRILNNWNYFCNTSGTSCYWRQNTELDR